MKSSVVYNLGLLWSHLHIPLRYMLATEMFVIDFQNPSQRVKEKIVDLIVICMRRARRIWLLMTNSAGMKSEIMEEFSDAVTRQLPDVWVFIRAKEALDENVEKQNGNEDDDLVTTKGKVTQSR